MWEDSVVGTGVSEKLAESKGGEPEQKVQRTISPKNTEEVA